MGGWPGEDQSPRDHIYIYYIRYIFMVHVGKEDPSKLT